MRRRRQRVSAGAGALAIAALVTPVAPEPPAAGGIALGPHKANMRWISFAAVLPIRKAAMADKAGIGKPSPGVWLPLEDRSDVVAGYLLVEKSKNPREQYMMYDGQFAHVLGWTTPAIDEWVVPVPFAPDPKHRNTVLVISDREKVRIRLPYSPDSLQARWPPIVVKAGPCKFTGFGYQCVETDRVHVFGVFMGPQCTDWVWDEHVGADDGKHYGGAVFHELSYLDGKIMPSGDLRFTGEVRFWTSRKSEYDPDDYDAGYKRAKPYKYDVLFRPRPSSGRVPNPMPYSSRPSSIRSMTRSLK
jgi:hypothetical protein